MQGLALSLSVNSTLFSSLFPRRVVLDASALGASSSGALSGSVYQLGDFDQCLQAAAPWPAQYCLAAIDYRVPHTGALPLHHQVYRANGTVWDKVHVSVSRSRRSPRCDAL